MTAHPVNPPAKPVVAIIPARGGSKRIPHKNIRPFLGTPILAAVIEKLHQAEVFDRITVTTDDPEIAAVARAAGADVPFLRPDALSDDHTGTEAVIRHAIGELESDGTELGPVCAVYATAVLLEPDDVRQALHRLRDEGREFVFSASTFDFPIQRALELRPDGSCAMVHPEHLATRSQDLPERFHDAGQFYWGTREAWLAARPVFTSNSAMHLIPRHRSQDIDTLEDWDRAEALARAAGSSR